MFQNSPSDGPGNKPAIIETGVIANVNVRNLTADWVSQYSGKQIPDLQIMTPYLHFNNGEGFTCIPEVGAICTMCMPSDGDPPFIMGFLCGPEMEGADVDKYLEDKLKDPGVETEEDLPASNTSNAGGSTAVSTNPTDASFRGGRPILNPGDMLWQGRDENFVVLKRGGVLQLGSTQICQRAYIPLLNYIRDFCENYELNTAAGTLSWQVLRDENNPSGDAPTELHLIAREHAQDKKASVKVSVGSLEDATKPPGGDTTFIEVTIAPEKIDADSGSVSGKPKYVIRLDKEGNTYRMQGGDCTEEIDGDHTLTIKGKQTVKVTGAQEVTALSQKTVLTATHEIQGTISRETWTGPKSITAALLKLGSEAASEPAVLGLKLVAWLASHTHLVKALPDPAPGPPSLPTLPPVTAAQTKDLVSKTVLVNQ
jgi:hypothetical protein